MPRYTFTINGDEAPTEADLHDDHAAWIEAVHVAGEMLRDMDGKPPGNGDWQINVTNEGGGPIGTVRIQAQRYLPLS
jgi:hypothetical protein